MYLGQDLFVNGKMYLAKKVNYLAIWSED